MDDIEAILRKHGIHVRRNDLAAQVARHRLHARLNGAVAALPEQPSTPTYVVDLDAFDANAADLARRAGGKPIRVASKSLRVPALIARALGVARVLRGAGLLAARGAVAVRAGRQRRHRDGLPDRRPRGAAPAARLRAGRARAVTLMVDDVRAPRPGRLGRAPSGRPVRVAIDVDAGLRLGPAHVGPKRSPLYDAADVVELARRRSAAAPGFALVGVMTYEGQVAGVPDEVPRSGPGRSSSAGSRPPRCAQLEDRRAEIASRAARGRRAGVLERRRLRLGRDLGRRPGGHRGGRRLRAAGAGAVRPLPSFEPRPAAFFGLPVVRRPSAAVATVAGGGFDRVAGRPARTGCPVPWAPPGLHLTGLEGAGEVQTPLTGPGAPRCCDRRPGVVPARQVRRAGRARQRRAPAAPASEIVDTVPTYRGLGLRLVSGCPQSTAVAASLLGARAADARRRPAGLRRRPAGSGKTTLAAAVASGFDELGRGAADAGAAHGRPVRRLGRPPPDRRRSSTALLAPLARGRPGRYRRYDWHGRRVRRDRRPCDPVPLLVVEGVGAALAVRRRCGRAGLGGGAVRRTAAARAGARRRRVRAALGAVGRATRSALFARERHPGARGRRRRRHRARLSSMPGWPTAIRIWPCRHVWVTACSSRAAPRSGAVADAGRRRTVGHLAAARDAARPVCPTASRRSTSPCHARRQRPIGGFLPFVRERLRTRARCATLVQRDARTWPWRTPGASSRALRLGSVLTATSDGHALPWTTAFDEEAS